MTYFIHVYFCEAVDLMQNHKPNANQEVSKTNQFSSVLDGLDRLTAASECMAIVQ